MEIKKKSTALESKLFSNIDQKIKKIGLIYFYVFIVLGAILALFGLILLFADSLGTCLATLLYAGILVVSGYVSACLIYGFGTIVSKHMDKEAEAVENSDTPVEQLPEL